jgi:TolA-binding protein
MAETRQKNFVERLADGSDKVASTLGGMRERMDELQRRVRGLEDVQKRVAELEKRVDKLEGKPEQPAAPTAEQPKAAQSRASSKPKPSGSSL